MVKLGRMVFIYMLLLLKLWLLDDEILYVDSLFSSFGQIEKAQLLTGTSTDPPE
ncbi:hypothetical protein RchiOBHm_Chr4g0392021 [Rosa chinensis]|uniref:Uncharacterized protein n=1 Tax=Rosa chinensis TaxID=74649 RepID=A0A2P6QQL9_ROSCH|nr:hypothetical protein RchiOBHm_Chr4g0392021 [Rosa chinensis]